MKAKPALGVLLLIVGAFTVVQGAPTIHAQGIATDGTGSGTGSGTNSVQCSLTTSNAGDLLYITAATQGTAVGTGSVTSSPSLTWQARHSPVSNGNTKLYALYAVWSGSGSITLTFTTGGTGNTGTAVVCFGVTGYDTSSIFDSGAPAYATGATTNPSLSMSTSNANDLLIGSLAQQGKNVAITAGSSFALVPSSSISGGSGASSNWVSSADEYKTVTSSGSQTIGFTDSSTNAWVEITDAIQQASGGGAYTATVTDIQTFSQSINQGLSAARSGTEVFAQTINQGLGDTVAYTFHLSNVFSQAFSATLQYAMTFTQSVGAGVSATASHVLGFSQSVDAGVSAAVSYAESFTASVAATVSGAFVVTVGYVMTFVQSISAQTGNSVKAVQQGWSLSLILFAAVPIALAIAYLYRQSRNGQGWRT